MCRHTHPAVARAARGGGAPRRPAPRGAAGCALLVTPQGNR